MSILWGMTWALLEIRGENITINSSPYLSDTKLKFCPSFTSSKSILLVEAMSFITEVIRFEDIKTK